MVVQRAQKSLKYPEPSPRNRNSLEEVEAAEKEIGEISKFLGMQEQWRGVRVREKESVVTCDDLGFHATGQRIGLGISDNGSTQTAYKELQTVEQFTGRFAAPIVAASFDSETSKAVRSRIEEIGGIMEAMQVVCGEKRDRIQRSGTGLFQSAARERSDWLGYGSGYFGKKERTGDCLFPWNMLKDIADGSRDLEEFKLQAVVDRGDDRVIGEDTDNDSSESEE